RESANCMGAVSRCAPRLGTARIGLDEPLSLTLSPLRGARELATQMMVVSKRSQHSGLRAKIPHIMEK
ncbi:MAG: hypothetical protein ABSA47_20190, partial [Verrucomicrobiota bacterium]